MNYEILTKIISELIFCSAKLLINSYIKYLHSSWFFVIFYCNIEEIVSSPVSEWNRESRAEAHTQLIAMSKFPFITISCTSQRVLSYTKGLSIKVQGTYVDVAHAFRDVPLVKSTLENLHQNVDAFHHLLIKSVKE